MQVESSNRRCRHRKSPKGKVASNIGWSFKEICIRRTQGSGWKMVRSEFREVQRLRGMKCLPLTFDFVSVLLIHQQAGE